MKPDESKPVFLYLATNHAGTLKIGISNNPLARYWGVDSHGLFRRGDKIELLRVCIGSRQIEAEVCRRFKHLRRAGREWYAYSEDICAFFASLPDATRQATKVKQKWLDNRASKRREPVD